MRGVGIDEGELHVYLGYDIVLVFYIRGGGATRLTWSGRSACTETSSCSHHWKLETIQTVREMEFLHKSI